MLALWLATDRPAPPPVVVRLLAKCRSRRRVCWLSLTLEDDLGLLPFSVCGLTCAAHMAGATTIPLAITTRRRPRIPNLDILQSFPCLEKFVVFRNSLLEFPIGFDARSLPANSFPRQFPQPLDTTVVTVFQAITKFRSNKISAFT